MALARSVWLVLVCVPALWAAVTLNDYVSAISGVHYCVRHDKESRSNLVVGHIKSEELCVAACSSCRWVTRNGFRDEAEFQGTLARTLSSAFATQAVQETETEPHVRLSWLVKIQDDVPVSHEHVADWQTRSGVHFGQYVYGGELHQGNFFLIVASFAQAQVIESFAEVEAVAPYPHHLKIAPHLFENLPLITAGSMGDLTGSTTVELLVSLHRVSLDHTFESAKAIAVDVAALLAEGGVGLARDAFVVSAEDDTLLFVQVPVSALQAVLDALSAAEDVSWLDLSLKFKALNYMAKGIMQSGTIGGPNVGGATPFYTAGLHGEGEIVAVADSGSDYNSCFFHDPATTVTTATGQTFTSTTHRKLAQYIAFADANEGELGGHGTHVSGTILGLATSTNAVPNGNGHAYNARLSFFDIGVANQQFLSVPNSLTNSMFPPQFNTGARLHSNSWGANSNQYDSRARDIDNYSWLNQEWLVLVAAGNSGPTTGTIGTPATAKNCVTVGASVSPDHGGGCPEGAAPCHENLASFSSLGPMYDNRQAPTIVAPGFFTTSARSAVSGTATNPAQCATTTMAGTSMATPTVTGNAALIRQYFREGRYPDGVVKNGRGFSPLGALVKAVLVNSAKVMTGTHRRNGDQSVRTGGSPNVYQGFGRVQLNRTLALPTSTYKFWAIGDSAAATRPQLRTGEGYSVSFDVTAGYPFVVTLVWSDFPGATNAATALVNDLDLNVTTPAGTVVFPNGRTSRDTLNVVESITLDTPAAGTYTVRVGGFRVVQGPQPFALVATGTFTPSTPGVTPPSTPSNPFPPPSPGGTSEVSEAKQSSTIAAGVMLPIAIIVVAALLVMFGAPCGQRVAGVGSSAGLEATATVTAVASGVLLLLVIIATAVPQWAKQGEFHMGLWQSCPGNGADCTDTLDIADGKSLVQALRFFMMTSLLLSAFTTIAAVLARVGKAGSRIKIAYALALATNVFLFFAMCLFAAYFNDVLMPLSGNLVESDYAYYLCITSFFLSVIVGMAVYALWKVSDGEGGAAPRSPAGSTTTKVGSYNPTTTASKAAPARAPAPAPASTSSYPTPAPMTGGARAPPPRGPPPRVTLPADWIAYTTDEGDPYYYNTKTQETRWEVPT